MISPSQKYLDATLTRPTNWTKNYMTNRNEGFKRPMRILKYKNDKKKYLKEAIKL